MPTVTGFNTKARYIFLPIFIVSKTGNKMEFDAILDSGAPNTEFSDHALQSAGFLEELQGDVQLKPGLSTQKYGKTKLPRVEICSHHLADLTVYVSRFEKSWGVDALIGLDFFRRFRVTIDYKKGELTTEAL